MLACLAVPHRDVPGRRGRAGHSEGGRAAAVVSCGRNSGRNSESVQLTQLSLVHVHLLFVLVLVLALVLVVFPVLVLVLVSVLVSRLR